MWSLAGIPRVKAADVSIDGDSLRGLPSRQGYAVLAAICESSAMSRYDELRSNFSKYQQDARESCLKHQHLLLALADGLQSFLGCPKSFVDPRTGAEHRYVIPTAVTWRQDRFVVSKEIPTGIHTHDDGRHYFSLSVYLEEGESEHPKRPFAVLLSAQMHADDIEIRVEDTEPKFSVHMSDPDGLSDLYGEIVGVIKDCLDRDYDGSKPHLGFTEPSCGLRGGCLPEVKA